MILIDAQDLIVGRLATFAAKKALLGNQIRIINSEKAVFSGRKANVFKIFLRKLAMGTPARGPFIRRSPERILKRSIRGMLDYKKPRGKEAFQRILCYVGVPDEFKDMKPISVDGANKSKLPNMKFTTLYDISKRIGAKLE